MQCRRYNGEGRVRHECRVLRCSRNRRFGHVDAQCVPSYANVVGPASADAANDDTMDVRAAEEAAEGSRDIDPTVPGTVPPHDTEGAAAEGRAAAGGAHWNAGGGPDAGGREPVSRPHRDRD